MEPPSAYQMIPDPELLLDTSGRTPSTAESKQLLGECLKVFIAGLRKAARMSADTATDLFEHKDLVEEKDELDFLMKREEWVNRFTEVLTELIERRFTGTKRRGRRPDVDISVATLRVLNAFDQEKQAAIADGARKLRRWARKELEPLDLRIALLLGEMVVRDCDNPFGPDYVIDAIGASSRAMFPNPRVWRPFMERVLGDIAPAVPKTYITLNRLLADRGVLPEIKAALRARSELRPADDKDLLPLFHQLIDEAGPNVESIDIEVPPILGSIVSEPGDAAVEEIDAAPASATPPDGPPSTSPVAATPPAAPAAASTPTPAPATGHAAPSGPASARNASPMAPNAPSSASTGPWTAASAAPVSSDPGPMAAVHSAPVGEGAAPAHAFPSTRTSPETRAAVEATAQLWRQNAPGSPRGHASEANPFPTLDPLMTLGSSSPVFEVLAQWQSFDPQDEDTQIALRERGVDTAALPLNRVPYIRAAMAREKVSPTDKITMDVISLLFEYIFRDPSIPDSARGIFGRLQVPILKAALLERTFFSDKNHPARRLLDHLASGAVGSSSEKAYRIAFENVAKRVVDDICRDFVLDVAVFDRADRELVAFLEGEQRNVAGAITDDIEDALEAESQETDRAHARALVRDRLAGLRLPLDVRMFAETAWADYLTMLRQQHGENAPPYRTAMQTMDDLLWSITAKERTAQKTRLTKMVPGIITNLRKGCAAVSLPDERAKAFFETLYQLHIAAIKPRAIQRDTMKSEPTAATPPRTGTSTPQPMEAALEETSRAKPITAEEEAAVETGGFRGTNNYHDYVSEMAVGTWLEFRTANEWITARLTWVSPLRTKYIFTSRMRSSAFVYSPEELAWELDGGRARIMLEPVPLFDRAVSAALDSIAARKKSAAH